MLSLDSRSRKWLNHMECSPASQGLSAQVRFSSGCLRPSHASGSPAIICHCECRWFCKAGVFGCHQCPNLSQPKMGVRILQKSVDVAQKRPIFRGFGGHRLPSPGEGLPFASQLRPVLCQAARPAAPVSCHCRHCSGPVQAQEYRMHQGLGELIA